MNYRCAHGDLVARAETAEAQARSLAEGMISNRRVGMAIGILMAGHGLTEAQAHDLLFSESQRRNIKVRVLAEDVIYTGTIEMTQSNRTTRVAESPTGLAAPPSAAS